MRLAYLDCFSGISGDMVLGALVDAGADLAEVTRVLAALPIEEFAVERERADIKGFSATRIHLRTRPMGVIRTFASIRGLLAEAELAEPARQTALRVYRRLAEAVAKVHGKEPELVTFHEWGELDCLVEVVGTAIALHQLGIERVYASAVPTGIGMLRTEHGMVPLPRPEVMEMLHGVPTYSRGIPVELVTGAGAAILASVSEGYGDLPMMRAETVGYGAGELRLDFPNVLRVVIGDEEPATARGGPSAPAPAEGGNLLVFATLADVDAERVAKAMERLTAAGATEAWASPATGRGGEAATVVWSVVPSLSLDAVVAALRPDAEAGRVRWTQVSGAPPD